ncbi:MAG: ABC transporter, partial [Eubacteriales bacterium]|nr:ABC transporter [Eubacteriales bacterium]
IPNTAMASLVSYGVVILLLAAVVYHLIQNLLISGIVLIGCEGILFLLFLIKRTAFEGSFQKLLSLFYMNGRLTSFFDGILDVSAIIYYLTIIVIALFLTGQTIRKQRWS